MLQERPFLIPLLAMASGLVIADQSGFCVPVSVPAALLLCLALSCLIRNRTPFIICCALFFLAWGLSALTPWKTPDPSSVTIALKASRKPLTIEGIVRSRPTVSASGSSLVIRTERVFRDMNPEQVSGDMLLYIGEGDVTAARGDRIRFISRLTVPQRLGLPGEFDYPRYLAFQGVSAIGRVATKDDLVLMRGAAEDSLLRRIDGIAVRLGDFMRAAEPDTSVSSVMTALLIGDQKRIPVPLSDAYTRAGVNHILSISGFHVGIIGYCIVMFVLFLATRSEYLAVHFNLRRTVVLLSLPTMLFYLFLTGAAPATARSVIMLAALVLALYAERETDPVNVLLLAAFLLISLHPPDLFDISFQLSFLALWGIVVFVPPIMACFKSVERAWLRTLIQFVAASCAASCVTAIPVLSAFNMASLNGIFSNFLMVPLLGYGAVLTGFCALPLVYIYPQAATALFWIAGRMVELSNWLILKFAQLPVLRFYGITARDMLLSILFMCSVTFLRPGRLKKSLCCLLPSVAILIHLISHPGGDGRLHITMLSVGQAESLLIRMPDSTTMLIDGGGYLHDTGRDFGERVLAPALFKLGVQRIDYLVLTHSHPDHIGGMPYLARRLPVGVLWEAGSGGVGPQYEQLRKTLAEAGTPVRQLKIGDEIVLSGSVRFKVLSPPEHKRAALSVNDMGMNEDSLVLRLAYGDFSMLFTADAGIPSEEAMLASGAGLRSTVLKVGHHGSRHSSSPEFLRRVSPRAALISAGRNNNFGLPSPVTIKLLERSGVTTYRTDRDGTINLLTDGRSWSIGTPYREN